MGTNAPVATRPLILCSMVSATSKGFFNTAGMATPAESFTKQAATSNRAGTQNSGLANHGSLAFCSGVLAWKYCQAPTALTPMSGEIATPVIREMVWANCWPGKFLSVVVAMSDVSARAVSGAATEAALRALEQNSWLAGALGRNGRQFFRDQYSWPVIERTYLDMLDRLSRGDCCRSHQRDAHLQRHATAGPSRAGHFGRRSHR